eukprot:TRINITY_DN15661_c0_g1_i1.p1 TRINITY_DN15661_c0_g1~~TRINITY_DN15661_c0_g1_i1.p1  ORF type:complete len:769 (+),score=228.92 TRINITY_DN15661_c0_g1_i1:60-2366(+)
MGLPAAVALAALALPNGHVWGCYNVSKHHGFCDTSLGVDARIEDLIARLTLEEKIGLVAPDVTLARDACSMRDSGVARLGIPAMAHLVETNTAVASCCVRPGQCPTMFPSPLAMGATFNTTLWHAKGSAMGDEQRALANGHFTRCLSPELSKYVPVGLQGYGPNINIAHDPRWGRTSEVPGEDPYLSGEYAVHEVQGAQGGDDPRYQKVSWSLKHYTGYNVETNRGGQNDVVSMHDLWETHLPQYQAGMNASRGNAAGVMCSYNAVNGVPLAVNKYLLKDVLRGRFGRPDALVGTDCGCMNNLIVAHKVAANATEAAAMALLGGTDMELGDTIWTSKKAGGQGALEEAMNETLLEALDVSVGRALRWRFLTGQFDPAEDQPYTQIPLDVVGSKAHWELAYQSALQGMVLLKNADDTLPLPSDSAKRQTVALLGPHIDSQQGLISGYYGDAPCWTDGTTSDKNWTCIQSVLQEFVQRVPEGTTLLMERGTDFDTNATDNIDDAALAAEAADVAFLFVGITRVLEFEGMDRKNVTLPGLQGELVKRILAVKAQRKGALRVVVVMLNGGGVSLGRDVIDAADAVVEGFYPSIQGARAIFDAVFGLANRWGRMPYTVMPAEDVNALDIANYDMAKAPGRTYKYYKGEPEFAFGQGLSYTTFALSECGSSSVGVTNTGQRDGDAVLMLFHRPGDDVRRAVGGKHPVPAKQLVAFARKTLPPGSAARVAYLGLPGDLQERLALVNEKGDRVLYPGTHYLDHFDGVNTCTYTYHI